MNRYIYKARDSKSGAIIKGVIQAENERAAGKLLIERGYTPDTVMEDTSGDSFFDKFKNKVTTKDKIVFTRQFSTLIGAGLPLSNSLRVLIEQTGSKPMRRITESILADVEAGRSLTQACAKFPEVFNRIYLALLKAGESSGTLDMSLKRLANQQEKDYAMVTRIKNSLTYPAIVLAVIIGVLLFMVIGVVPQVQQLYHDLGKELPAITNMLVAFTNFLVNMWWLVTIVLGLIIYFVFQFVRTDSGRHILARIKLNMPVFKLMFWRLYNGRFARTAENLLSTGVSIQDTLAISAEAINNLVMEEQIKEVSEKVKQGKTLSASLKELNYILPLLPQMAAIGEESGKIDEMLGKAANVYEDELDQQINTISTLIEPIMLVIMTLMVAVIIAGVLMPIYQLVSQIQK